MRQIVLIFAFVATVFSCTAQKEHLEPARDFNQARGILKEYYDRVLPLLYTGFSEKPVARYTAVPSFSYEYSFSLETAEDKKYIVTNSLSENFWYAKDRNKVELISNRKEISNDLYLKIADLFTLLIEQAKRKPFSNVLGVDGITYYFATTDKNGETKTGETWSPLKNSLLKRLINICDTIFSTGNGKNTPQADISKEIDILLNDLKQ